MAMDREREGLKFQVKGSRPRLRLRFGFVGNGTERVDERVVERDTKSGGC